MIKFYLKSTGALVPPGNRTIRISKDYNKIEMVVSERPRTWTEIEVRKELCPRTGEEICNCGTTPVANTTPSNPPEANTAPTPPHEHPPVANTVPTPPANTSPSNPPVANTTPDNPPHDHPPVIITNPAEFVAAYKAAPDTHSHGSNTGMATEHMDVLNLVPKTSLDKVAVQSGLWNSPSTWYPSGVPTAGQKIGIPPSIKVTYNHISEVEYFSIRVDGILEFQQSSDSKLLVNTIVVTPTGKFLAGTREQPVYRNVEIVISGGAIDTVYDRKLLSKGIISHGEVEIFGTQKTTFERINSIQAGATQFTVQQNVLNWRVGDLIAITGTRKKGWAWNGSRMVHSGTEDELVTITGINGNTFTVNRAFQYPHIAPTGKTPYAANLTRTVTVRSAVKTPVHHRGHTMFMHSNKVNCYYAAFVDMGRTDKSFAAADVGTFSSIQSNSNVKGRYPVHLHKTGTLDQANPSKVIGCVVNDSPGWGFAHHSSHADFIDCVSYNVFGAGFAAEDGDETGDWKHNIAIKSHGATWGDAGAKEDADVRRHDNGRTGDGFFFAGRLVGSIDNVAAGTSHGFTWMHRSAPTRPYAANMEYPETAYGLETLPVDKPPIHRFSNNESFCNEVGLVIVKSNPNQNHDARSVLNGFSAWEVNNGIDLSYTAHYTMLNFDLAGIKTGQGTSERGVRMGTNSTDMVFVNLKVDSFGIGVEGEETFTFPIQDTEFERVFISPQIINCRNQFAASPSRYRILTANQLFPGRLSYTNETSLTINIGSPLNIEGIKTDSISSRKRKIAEDGVHLEWHDYLAHYIHKVGFWMEGSTPVLLIPDLISDRPTGSVLKMTHKIRLNGSRAQLENNWSVSYWGGAKFLGNL